MSRPPRKLAEISIVLMLAPDPKLLKAELGAQRYLFAHQVRRDRIETMQVLAHAPRGARLAPPARSPSPRRFHFSSVASTSFNNKSSVFLLAQLLALAATCVLA